MFPIIIFDKSFYKEILDHNERMLKEGTISKRDQHLFLITDSIEEAIAHIKEKSIKAFGLQYKKTPKPFWGFFETEIKPARAPKKGT
jgi:predicted Rossmann-fold nucleotide-binding protein